MGICVEFLPFESVSDCDAHDMTDLSFVKVAAVPFPLLALLSPGVNSVEMESYDFSLFCLWLRVPNPLFVKRIPVGAFGESCRFAHCYFICARTILVE